MEKNFFEEKYEKRQKDWVENVYKGGKEKEITLRALLLGLIIGAILSLSNLYVGFKTGWSLGVTITAAIMSFALFKTLRKILPFLFKRDIGLLELNILQTTSSACAFIASAGLVSAVPALMMVSSRSLSNFHLILWVMTILYLGLFMAIPMKKQMIDVEDLRFPTGFATSEVLKGMFAKGDEALHKARALFVSLSIGVVIAWLRDGIIGFPVFLQGKIVKCMGVWQWKRLLPSIPATFGLSSLSIMSIPLTRLTLSFEGSFIMIGAGAIMGIRAGASLLVGALIGYGILTPMAIKNGDIVHDPPKIVSEHSFTAMPKIYSNEDLLLPLTIEKGSLLAVSIQSENGDKVVAKKWEEDKKINSKKELLEYFNSRMIDGDKNPFSDDLLFGYDSSTNRVFLTTREDSNKSVTLKILEGEKIPLAFSSLSSNTSLKFPLNLKKGMAFSFKIGNVGAPKGDFKEEILTLILKDDLKLNDEDEFLKFFNGEKIFDGDINPFYNKISFIINRGKVEVSAAKLVQWDAFIESLSSDGNEFLGIISGKKNTVKYGGFKYIVKWLMWPGVAMMVAAGLLSFFMQYKTILRAFQGLSKLFGKKSKDEEDAYSKIDIPASWFLFGLLFIGFFATLFQILFFGISLWMGVFAVIMTFFLAIVACRATGETDITPVGAMGKITQLLYGAIAPGNMVANLMTANVTGGAATSSADLLQALKCGYRVGASPRKQFMAMLLGVVGGALVCVPVYNILVPNPDVLGTEKLPAPSAQTWAGVAILLSKGLSALPLSARWGLLWGAVFGIVVTLLEKYIPKSRNYLPSPTAMGIAFVIPAFNCISMFIGSLIAYILEKKDERITDKFTIPVASGLIAGESIMGILIAILIAFQFL